MLCLLTDEKYNHQPSYKSCSLQEWPAFSAYWCNSDKNVMAGTSNFVKTGLKPLHQIEPTSDIAKIAKNLRLDRLWIPEGKVTGIILQKPHGNKMTPNDILPCSTIIRETSHSIWELAEYVGLDNVQKVGDLGSLISKWYVILKFLHSRLRDVERKGYRKTLRARGTRGLQGNSVVEKQQSWYTSELMKAVADCTRPAQFKPDKVLEPEDE